MNIKFRFFQRLTTGQRMAVFQAFGVLGDDFDGKLTHSEEVSLLAEMLAGIRGAEVVAEASPTNPDSTTAPSSGEHLACVKCRTPKHDNRAYCLECGGNEFDLPVQSTKPERRAPSLDHEQQTAAQFSSLK